MTTAGTLQDFGPFLKAEGFADALALWDALHAYYLQRRPIKVAFFAIYPETTVCDVQQVAGLLAAEILKLPADALGRADAVARWSAYRNEIQRATAQLGLLTFDVYPDNERFWTEESKRIAVDLWASATLPTKSDLVLEAVKRQFRSGRISMPGMGANQVGRSATLREADVFDSVVGVVDDFVEATKGVAGEAADLGKQGADAAVDIVKDVAGGAKDLIKGTVTGVSDAVIAPVFNAIGKPLLIGAAVVGGLLVVPKLLDGQKKRRAS